MAEEYERKSDSVEIKADLFETEFRINGEWCFSLPDEYSYDIDSEYDDGITGGCDMSGSVKPLVIKCRLPGSGSLVQIAVQKHYDMMGQFYGVEDCKWDNREGQDGFTHDILIDCPELYVDQYTASYWPMAIFEGIRVRGPNVTEFDFQANIIQLDEADRETLHDMMSDLACSIEACDSAAENSSGGWKWSADHTAQEHLSGAAFQGDGDYRISGTVLKGYRGNEGYLYLPEGITEIGDHAFSGNQNIKMVWISDGVMKIGDRAFENCFQLQTVHLPDSLESIGSYAFSDCHELQDLQLPENLKVLGDSAFTECFQLQNVELPGSLRSIDAFTFKNCTCFTEMILPESVSSIGLSAFAGCSQMEDIYIPDRVTEILDNLLGQSPFEGCSQLKVHLHKGSYADQYFQKLELPIVYEGENAYSEDCESDEDDSNFDVVDGVLENYYGDEEYVAVPNGVSEIGEYAFSSNNHMRGIELPEGLRSIGADAFCFCEGLEKISLPDSLEEIGESAFMGCKKLESLSIPASVRRIGSGITLMCDSLKDVFIPASITCAEEDCFSCYGATIHTPEGSPAYRMALKKGYRVSLDMSACVAETAHEKSAACSEMAAEEAGNCPGMDIEGNRLSELICTAETVVLPEALRYIMPLTGSGNQMLKQLCVNSGMQCLQVRCFSDCPELQQVDLPDSLELLGGFTNCPKLKNIEIPANVVGILDFTMSETGIEELRIPDGTTFIGSWAFSDCLKLKSVYIPATVEFIGDYAFSECEGAIFHVHEGSAAHRYVDKNGFNYDFAVDATKRKHPRNCFSPGVPAEQGVPGSRYQIKDHVLEEYCNDARSIVIPDGVEHIQCGSFEDCMDIREVAFPNSLKSIEEYTFNNSNIQHLSLPEGFREMGECAFSECYELRSVSLPSTLLELPDDLFSGCIRLESVVIPEGVKSISNSAFDSCSSLKSVTLPESLLEIDDSAFDLNNFAVFHVVPGSYAEEYCKENDFRYDYQ